MGVEEVSFVLLEVGVLAAGFESLLGSL